MIDALMRMKTKRRSIPVRQLEEGTKSETTKMKGNEE